MCNTYRHVGRLGVTDKIVYADRDDNLNEVYEKNKARIFESQTPGSVIPLPDFFRNGSLTAGIHFLFGGK